MTPFRQRQFELAERLGMTVGELEERMTAEEYIEWQEYDSSHHPVELIHTASIVATLYNTALGNKKRHKAEDFLPKLDDGTRVPPTVDQFRAKWTARRERINAYHRQKTGNAPASFAFAPHPGA